MTTFNTLSRLKQTNKKTFQQIRHGRELPQSVKGKPIASIVLNDENLTMFFRKIWEKSVHPTASIHY